MYSNFRLLLTCLLFSISFKAVDAQVVVPPENAGRIDDLFRQLDFPDNYERALELMAQSQLENQPVLMEYYGLQAIDWAKEQRDSSRIISALTLLKFNIEDRGEYARADSFLNIALKYAPSNNQKALIYLDKIGSCLRTSNWTDMAEYLRIARSYIGNDTLSPAMAEYYFNKGLYHFEADQDFIAAQIAYQRAKNGAYGDEKFLNAIDANLSNLYLQIELFDKAQVIIQKNLDDAIEEGEIYNELFALYGLGYIALEQSKYDELKSACDQIFRLNGKHGIAIAFGYAYFLLGEYYLAENQLDSAKVTFQKGIQHSEQRGEENELVDCLGGMMRGYIKEENYQKAIESGERAVFLQTRPDHDIEEQLAFAYQQIGRHKEAYETLKIFTEQNNDEELKRTNILLTSKLIEDRFAQEREEVELRYESTLSKQRLQLLRSVLGLIILGALLTMYLQMRSRKKLEKLNDSLLESNQALRQFAYIASHDLKEPIRNITSFSNLLNRRLKQKESTRDEQDFLGFITSNAIVLKEIVDSLQIFTSISFGEIKKEIVQLNSVFTAVQSNLRFIIKEKKGLLVFDKQELTSDVYFSRPMLILLLQNLIQNGFKYNDSEHPIVKVTIKPMEGKTLFQVKDNGEGIAPEYFERIFTPFKTLKNKSLTQSSGLGLSICKNILDRYGGRIWVDSDGHTGSTFSFLV